MVMIIISQSCTSFEHQKSQNVVEEDEEERDQSLQFFRGTNVNIIYLFIF